MKVFIIAAITTKKKSNLLYTRANTPKRVTSGGIHLRGLAFGQHSSDKTSQRWRTAADLTAWQWNPRPIAPIACVLKRTQQLN